ncbi:hypothetical protein [Spirosoma linguale]|uniref:hypothetical protein n=1 Tax=Spirosoma linguale TaxID=108 RepID=UPI003CC7C57E
MKTTIFAAFVAAALYGGTASATVPSQDKPVSKTTTTTVKKATPTKTTATSTTVHKKHVKSS